MVTDIGLVSFSPLAAVDARRRADVVFLHGLMGDPRTTWTATAADGKASSWLEWIAADLADVAVWSVGYPTTVAKWVGRSMPLSDLATSVADELLVRGVGVDRPLVFVGHSMGGLVIKKMILESANHSQDRWRVLAANTRAVMFLATPHTGSDLPALGSFLEALGTHLVAAGAGAVTGMPGTLFGLLAGMFGRKSTSMDELRDNAPMLRDLNLGFRQYIEKRRASDPVQVVVYFETQKTWNLQVVDEASADPGLPTADLVGLVTNHLEICKFAGKEGARPYHRLAEIVRALAPPAGVDATDIPTSVPTPPLRADADIRPTSLSIAEQGLDDSNAPIIVVTCLVTEDAEGLVRYVRDWQALALRDPLVPESVRKRARRATLASLFTEPALRPRLLDGLATTPFSGYVYFANRSALAGVGTPDLRRRLLVQPIADRLRKKSTVVTEAQGNRPDLATSLAMATEMVATEQLRALPRIEVRSSSERSPGLLVELAQLVSAAIASHIAAPDDPDAATLFEHVRTRVRFAKNVATNEIHLRDRNPLP